MTDCTSTAQEGSAWLGGVGRTGSVSTPSGSVVAYDLNSNAPDNLKSNTSPVLTGANVALSGEENAHTLFLNPFMQSDYARGNAEDTASDNDADLFDDDRVGDRTDIIGADNAKIGTLTDAQLSHHKYDWANGTVTDQAAEGTYGVVRYACTNVCSQHVGNTASHPNSFDCDGTYVYAPLVGVTFDDNVDDDSVSGMPDAQTDIAYAGTATVPESAPVRTSTEGGKQWVFTGWYVDAACTEEFDFSTALTDNWTVVYAGWEQADAPSANIVGTKILNGAALGADQFSFEIKGSDGTSRVVKNAGDGSIDFGTFVFEPVEGTYEYTVNEVKGDQENVTYDDSIKKVTVTVARDETGAYVAAVSGDDLTFVNTYTAPTPAGPTTDTDLPSTGDSLPTGGVVAVLAVAGVAVVIGSRLVFKRHN